MLLPSLDRLSTLIERVVELIDAVGSTPAAPAEPVPERPSGPSSVVTAPAGEDVWLVFLPTPQGYRLMERTGALPAPGDAFELEDARYRVLRLAPSPLPGDRRRCAHVEREEPRAEDRSFDA